MKRSLILAAIAAVSLLAEDQQPQDPNPQDSTNTVKSEKKSRIRLAGISLGAGYSHFSGYPFYPGYRPLFLDSYYYGAFDPFYFPGYWNGYQRGPEMGEVKLHSPVPGAEVYLNGGYAGEARKLKDIWLDSGVYQLRVTADNRPPFDKKIYVLSGKTLRIDVELGPEVKP